jgi:C1A family cysteine protease
LGIVGTRGYVSVAKGDPNAHIAALQLGPVSIGLAASSSAFMYYSSGILNSSTCGSAVNHGVTLVGYGADANGNAYWIVKNSWGAYWGE